MKKRKILFVMNPVSGSGRALEALPYISMRMTDRSDIQYKVYISTGVGTISDEVRKNQEAGFNEFVAVGGDGTISEIVNGLNFDGPKPTVGIIPAGSGNDLAKVFGLDIGTSLDNIINNKVNEIDLCTVNGMYFINTCSFGIDAPVTRQTLELKKKFPPKMSYFIASMKTIFSFPPKPVTMTVDGERIDDEIYMVAVSNGIYIGGGMKIAPDAIIDDGYFDLCIISKVSKFKLIRYFPKLYTGRFRAAKEVRQIRCKNFTIQSNEELIINIDGNLVGQCPARIGIIHKGINFFGNQRNP